MDPTEAFVRDFVARERQDRYLALARKPGRREDFVWALAHDGRHLERRLMRRLSDAEATPSIVGALLKSLGAGRRCFVVAARYEEFDNCEAETTAVLDCVVGKSRDSIVYFPGAGLAYYENHEGERHLLHRPAARQH